MSGLGREREILETLLRKVHLVSLDQAGTTWWGGTRFPRANAASGMDALVRIGDLHRQMLLTKPANFRLTPVIRWHPSEPDPDPEVVSYHLKSRWTEAPRETVVYAATARAAYRFGGFGGPIRRPDQATHDLLLAAVYLKLRNDHPTLARHWVGEESYREERLGQKLPDAIIYDDHSPPRVRMVMESGGEYDPDRVEAFHRDCKARGHGYQLW